MTRANIESKCLHLPDALSDGEGDGPDTILGFGVLMIYITMSAVDYTCRRRIVFSVVQQKKFGESNLMACRRYFVVALSIMTFFIALSSGLRAESVKYGKSVPSHLKNDEIWLWTVKQSKGSKILDVRLAGTDHQDIPALLEVDISDCSFCDGEGDNCAEDGVRLLEIPAYPNPLALVICHVGVHSQRLMIFDPLQDRLQPTFLRTGAYWVNASISKGRLVLKYDKAGYGPNCLDEPPGALGFCDIQEVWPIAE